MVGTMILYCKLGYFAYEVLPIGASPNKSDVRDWEERKGSGIGGRIEI